MTVPHHEIGHDRRLALVRHAEAAAARRRTVDNSEVEQLVEVLASRMLQELGADRVGELRFRAVPRGGLIVLGQLAYALGLGTDQLDADADDRRPLCLVDDCALSGRRIGGVLARLDGEQPIVFAHLLSAPTLRAAIERSDPRVECIAADDLVDHRSAAVDADAAGASWEQRWGQRDSPGAYWRGQTDVIAFPWAEPDVAQWNETDGRLERGWRIQSPDRCLKTRYELGPARIGKSAARWRVPDDVVHGMFDGELLLYRLADGSLHQPSAEGALIWRMVARYGDEDAAVQGLVDAYGLDATTAATDVAGFVDTLRRAGLLEAV